MRWLAGPEHQRLASRVADLGPCCTAAHFWCVASGTLVSKTDSEKVNRRVSADPKIVFLALPQRYAADINSVRFRCHIKRQFNF